jgi:hypothetical protein
VGQLLLHDGAQLRLVALQGLQLHTHTHTHTHIFIKGALKSELPKK